MSYVARRISPADLVVPPPLARISVGYANGLLSGGLAARNLTMLYGQPGVGKSTLTVEFACAAVQSVSTVYAASPDEHDAGDPDEHDPGDVVRLAHRIDAPLVGVYVVKVDTIDDAITAAKDFRARMLVVDSLNACADFDARQMKAGMKKLRTWCRSNNAAALGVGMFDTAGRRAGGYNVAYGADAIMDLEIDERPERDELDELLVDQDLPAEDRSLRRLKLWKCRFGPVGSLVLRMTGGGLKPYEKPLDTQLRRLVDQSGESMVNPVVAETDNDDDSSTR
jgi:predicted ATP-dependent serine protease